MPAKAESNNRIVILPMPLENGNPPSDQKNPVAYVSYVATTLSRVTADSQAGLCKTACRQPRLLL